VSARLSLEPLLDKPCQGMKGHAKRVPGLVADPGVAKAVLPELLAAIRWITGVAESDATSSSLLIGQPAGALSAKRFDHHGCVHAIPQSPVRLRTPYLVEQRFELAVQIGLC
jgi:hypothetical protein